MFPSLENLTVEQMLHKQLEFKQKLGQATSAGMSPQIIEQIQTMIDFLNTEIRTKSEIEKLEEAKKQAIEEDKDDGDGVSLDIGS